MINKYKIFKGGLANIYGLFGITVIQLISLPIFLYYWGSEKYGEWIIIYNLPSLLILFDFGLASVTTSQVTRLITRNKIKTAKITFINSLLISLIIILLINIIIYFLLYNNNLDLNYYLNISNFSNINSSLFFISLYYTQSIWIEFLEGYLRANSYYPLASFITSSIRISDGIILCLLVINQFDAEDISRFIALLKFIQLIGLVIFTIKKTKLTFSFGIIRLKLNLKFFKKGITYLILPLNNILNNQIMLSFIGIIIGPSTAAIINIIKLILKFSTSFISIISSTIAFDINRLFSLRKIGDLKNLINKSEQLAIFINIFYIILFIIFYNTIIQNIFLNKKIDYIDPLIIYIYSAVIFINNLYIIKLNFHTAINIHEVILKKIFILSLLLNLLNLLILIHTKNIIIFLLILLLYEIINKKIIYDSFKNI